MDDRQKERGEEPRQYLIATSNLYGRAGEPLEECRFSSPQREGAMFGKPWEVRKESVTSFINDEALSRRAAIAFYAVTSIGPVLLIVVAISGLAFGQDAAQGVARDTGP